MTTPPIARPFHRSASIGILLFLGLVFASNHIAARIAFDHGTGLVTAVLVRSGATALALLAVVFAIKAPFKLKNYPIDKRWMFALGALIALQSLLLYSAVARIPVALALLIFNLFPALFMLLNWALGGSRPTARTALLMSLIVFGLSLVLDLPTLLQKPSAGSEAFWLGSLCALGAACTFAFALRVTEFKLKAMQGAVRSTWTMGLVTLLLIVLSVLAMNGVFGASSQAWVSKGLHFPNDATGWWALFGLTLCYGFAFSSFFALMPRLDMARNAPASNIEPVAALVLGWALLGQSLSWVQLLGVALVMTGIFILAISGNTAKK